ncbi:MAG: hypothetical protein NT007_12165 [Candidatus Kapabacteria bacterium]|nr:hypothetical protein [Candidatus Kapabacteria bacterium]
MEKIELLNFEPTSSAKIPFFQGSVSAGVPVSVDNPQQERIDLNEFLVDNPTKTFFAKIHGYEMSPYGIRDGDIAIVDSSLQLRDGNLVITQVGEDLLLKIFRDVNGEKFLESHNKTFLPLSIEPFMNFQPLGIVTKVIRPV